MFESRTALFESWTPARAWWLGALYGDGCVHTKKGAWLACLVGTLDIVTKWGKLIDPTLKSFEKKHSLGTYDMRINSKALVQRLLEDYDLESPKAYKLKWPHNLPVHLNAHFLRGLIDTDGSLQITNPVAGVGRQGVSVKYSSMSAEFVVDAAKYAAHLAGIAVPNVYFAKKNSRQCNEFRLHGSDTKALIDALYKDAPFELRSELKHKQYLEMVRVYEELRDQRCACGVPVSHEGMCQACWWIAHGRKNGPGVFCGCGEMARTKGLCANCYLRDLRSRKKAAGQPIRTAKGVCDCGAVAYRKGTCDACYSRKRRAAQLAERRAPVAGVDLQALAQSLKPHPAVLVCTECNVNRVLATGLCSSCYHKNKRAARQAEFPKYSLSKYLISGEPIKETWQALSPNDKNLAMNDMIKTLLDLDLSQFFGAEPEDSPMSAVSAAPVTLENGVLQVKGSQGQRTCSRFHSHRYKAKNRGAGQSVVEALRDPRMLERALRYKLNAGGSLTPKAIKSALSGFVHSPTNFAPALARWITDEYAPQGGIVLDPCAGYGGRLLGVLSSNKNVSYIGHDVEPETLAGNRQLSSYLGCDSRVKILEQAVEAPVPWSTSDLVLTSPPYFDAENYGEVSERIRSVYPSVDSWINGFLRSLITKALEAAPRFVLNIANTSAGNLPQEAIQLAQSMGHTLEQDYQWKIAVLNDKKFIERILVFKRKS